MNEGLGPYFLAQVFYHSAATILSSKFDSLHRELHDCVDNVVGVVLQGFHSLSSGDICLSAGKMLTIFYILTLEPILLMRVT